MSDAARAPVEELLALLSKRGWRLAAAESCTGGALLATLTAVPGATEVVWGGVVVYTAEAKARLCGLDPDQVERSGTVSEPVTRALAAAVRRRAGVEIGLAVTGWAGPDSSGPDPVGTVYLGVADEAGVRVERRECSGSREQVRAAAVREIVTALCDQLREPS